MVCTIKFIKRKCYPGNKRNHRNFFSEANRAFTALQTLSEYDTSSYCFYALISWSGSHRSFWPRYSRCFRISSLRLLQLGTSKHGIADRRRLDAFAFHMLFWCDAVDFCSLPTDFSHWFFKLQNLAPVGPVEMFRYKYCVSQMNWVRCV